MALHINFVSPPSSGKSTLSSELFSKMKKLGYKVELVTEVAKDYVYKKDFVSLSYQPLILGKQSFKNFKLDTQLDYIVNDAPFILSPIYLQENIHVPRKEFTDLVISMFKSYNSINFFLERNESFAFEEHGRVHSLEDSYKISKDIKDIYKKAQIELISIKNNEDTIQNILDILKERNYV